MGKTGQDHSVVIDVTEADFQDAVIARSHEVPVVVDFWAAWCGPCRTLGPLLERGAQQRGGDVILAKLDVDANPRLAQQFRIQGIPAVKAFRDGRVVAEFVGAQPAPQVEAFLDRLVPSAADRHVAQGRRLADQDPATAERAFRAALAEDPDHRAAAIGLAELRVGEDPDEALALVQPHRPAPEAEAVVTRVELGRAGSDPESLRAAVETDPDDADARLQLARALAATGAHAEAIEHLLEVVARGDGSVDEAREQLLGLFGIVDDPELVAAARRRLANLLF
jgi:putative thioredoxin